MFPILGVGFVIHKVNSYMSHQQPLLSVVKCRKLAWFGHISHHDIIFTAILQGTTWSRQKRRRQRKLWTVNILKWTGYNFHQWAVLRTVVANSDYWLTRDWPGWVEVDRNKWCFQLPDARFGKYVDFLISIAMSQLYHSPQWSISWLQQFFLFHFNCQLTAICLWDCPNILLTNKFQLFVCGIVPF